MVNGITKSTRTDVTPGLPKDTRTPKQKCEDKGGFWDAERGVCILVKKEDKVTPPPEVPKVDPTTPETFRSADTGALSGIDIDGKTFLGLRPQDVRQIAERDLLKREQPEGTAPVGTAQAQARSAEEAERLVGQTQPSPTTPTEGLVPGVDSGEALIVGFREAIPRALTLAGGAAVAGAAAGLATGGVLSVPLAIGAAAITFVGSITASILSNVKSQRTDDTNAQQRVLDEGKQTLQDWTTQAAADPSNRGFYISQFNKQLQQIQDAHVQMLTDTNADVLKFETSVPNLAEFNSFYSVGGERDALQSEMLRSLGGGVGELELNFRMIEMANRRTPQKTTTDNSKEFLGGLIP